MIGRKGPMN